MELTRAGGKEGAQHIAEIKTRLVRAAELESK